MIILHKGVSFFLSSKQLFEKHFPYNNKELTHMIIMYYLFHWLRFCFLQVGKQSSLFDSINNKSDWQYIRFGFLQRIRRGSSTKDCCLLNLHVEELNKIVEFDKLTPFLIIYRTWNQKNIDSERVEASVTLKVANGPVSSTLEVSLFILRTVILHLTVCGQLIKPLYSNLLFWTGFIFLLVFLLR